MRWDVFGWAAFALLLFASPWLVIFAGLHALAALKHHFIDRDATLVRMFGRTGK